MVANRGEIAIRVFRACTELGKRTVAVYSEEDSLALHRYKADEAYLLPSEIGPVEAYLDVDAIVSLAVAKEVDAIHPGYGFLAENAHFARRCAEQGIVFIGPSPDQLDLFGDKIRARELAQNAGVPVVPGTAEAVADEDALAFANESGYPVMLKAVSGGGGRGMRVAQDAEELQRVLAVARREATTAFGSGDIYVEKLVRDPRHIEVQILADGHGRVEHLWERDCSIQRRHQKVVETAPARGLDAETRQRMCGLARDLMIHAGYQGAGTVEFLLEPKGDFYFIEVNARIQVEHTVTELVMGIDLVQSQIRVAEGHTLAAIGIPDVIPEPRGYAIECRVTTEDPEHDFLPDTGRITHYRSPGGFGVRLDAATAFTGAHVSPHYDSLLVKVCTHATRFEDAIRKMDRALMEFRIRGLKTNIRFLENVVTHPEFEAGRTHTGFIAAHPELLDSRPRKDRGTRLLRYVGHIAVNGQVEGPRGRTRPDFRTPPMPTSEPGWKPPAATFKQILDSDGPEALVTHLRDHKRVLFTDTTFRDAHQSLLATRMRSYDLLRIARDTGRLAPNLFSMEVWGGATFDTALPLPERGSMGEAGPTPGAHSARPPSDASAGSEPRGVLGVSRQRREGVREGSSRHGNRRLPHLRLNELGTEHAGGDRRRSREGQDRRGRALLHGRRAGREPEPLRSGLLREPGQGNRSGRRSRSRHQGHGRPPQARGRPAPRNSVEGSHAAPGAPTHPRQHGRRRGYGCAGCAGGSRRGRRLYRRPGGRHVPAEPQGHRGGAPGNRQGAGVGHGRSSAPERILDRRAEILPIPGARIGGPRRVRLQVTGARGTADEPEAPGGSAGSVGAVA